MTSLLRFLITSIGVSLTVSQTYRSFPPLLNLARETEIASSPSESSCGNPARSTYCRSTITPDSVTSCIQEYCDQTCPLRYELPIHNDLLLASNYDVCVSRDTINRQSTTSFSAVFSDSRECYLIPDRLPVFGDNSQFTLLFWMRQSDTNEGTVYERGYENGTAVLSIKVSAYTITLFFNTAGGAQSLEFRDLNISPNTWVHVALQVYDQFANLFIDGTDYGSTPAVSTLLGGGPIVDVVGGMSRVGQNITGGSQYAGRLQDMRFYTVAISNREIDEVMMGMLPELHTQSACRCPASHPRVKPLLTRYCIKNGMLDTTNDQVLRLDAFAHPLEFLNDGDTNSVWISQQIEEVSLTIDMGDDFQVFYVVLQFYSPLPKAVHIERKTTDNEDWSDWQYYADNCSSYFGLANNGPLDEPGSVNCLQFTTEGTNVIPYSRGNITFNILSQAPVARPGHNNFYNTPELYGFVRARKVRVNMQGHYYVTNPRHQYYGIFEFLVTGRCDCNGHAANCDTSTLPYTCHCEPDSFTTGGKCAECHPLYWDKPFRVGDQTNSYSCKPCVCHDHADECVYNRTLDPFPNDHSRGGGGHCLSCKDNTEGRHCDRCRPLYYRDLSKELSHPEICLACACDPRGTVDGDLSCNPEGGQCRCKLNVQGRRCDQCVANTYNLVEANPLGCVDCGCDLQGTRENSMHCDGNGQCLCKDNVREEKCSVCDYGYFNLTSTNPEGCTACSCDARGSSSQFCDPASGICPCKTNVIGHNCDTCADNFWNISANCLPCTAHCDRYGTEVGTICNKDTGQCDCKTTIQGFACDQCRSGYFSFGSSPSQGCSACGCNTAGTVNFSTACDQATGQCHCKEHVLGITCNECPANKYGLSRSDPLGCASCGCDPTGTLRGDTLPSDGLPCDQNTGQCTCLSNRIGRVCDSCEATYYISTEAGGGCLACGCHPRGSTSQICDLNSGQCSCKVAGAGVGGRACNECLPQYYDFNNLLGSCTSCDCDSAGTINNTCNSNTGQCDCKLFVQGHRCDACVSDSSNLNAENPFGCSKLPAQQPPPSHIPLSPTALQLVWAAPDFPNGVILVYFLYRDGELVAPVSPVEHDPEIDPWFRYNDTLLLPYTSYVYRVEAQNEFGAASSPSVTFRTPAGAPSGDLRLNVTNVTSRSAVFRWRALSDRTGVIERYVVTGRSDMDPNTTFVVFDGLALTTNYTSLRPYTNYTFTVSACTAGGCSVSSPVWKFTAQAPPRGQADPVVREISATSFYVEWEPPSEANGVIIFYELWIAGVIQEDGSRDPEPTKIFNPAGQYNPRPSNPLENALDPPESNFTITGLNPFTRYQLQVLSQNDVGKVASNWIIARTLEALPTEMSAPIITPINSSSLYLQWVEPTGSQINGLVTIYRLLREFESDLEQNPFDPPTYYEEAFSSAVVLEFTITSLPPYTVHKFKVEVCNSVGCVSSDTVQGQTLSAAPSPPGYPLLTPLNSSSIRVEWSPPLTFNGPPPFYTAVRSEVAFSRPPPRVVNGTRFPGGGYYRFPSNAIPQGVTFTGVEFWFRTRQADGLLFYAASRDQEELLVLQLYAGRPWFLFDPEGCITAVTTTDDEVVAYNDGGWHYVKAERDGRNGRITIDGRSSTGVQDSSCASGTIVGTNTGVFVGGLPKDYIITRSDRDPRTTIRRQSFQGCVGQIRILQQKYPEELWTTLDWKSSIERRDCYPAWHGCPVTLEYGATHFLGRGWIEVTSTDLTTFSTDSVQMDFSFRTEYRDGVLLYIYGGRNVYMYCLLRGGSLIFSYRQDNVSTTVEFESTAFNLCDGQWVDVTLAKVAQQLTIVVNGGITRQSGQSLLPGVADLASYLYLGGIPPKSEASYIAAISNITFPRSFGGCLRGFRINRQVHDFTTNLVSFDAVHLDGCPAVQPSDGSCRESLEVVVANAPEINSVIDTRLSSFTDYMYKVVATNPGGSSQTDWIITTTREGHPQGVVAPYEATPTSGYAIEVKWNHPTANTGLIYSYILTAYDLQRAGVTVQATFNHSVILEGTIEETIPFTNYSISLTACTVSGCTESSSRISTKTLEEAPSDVLHPQVLSKSPSHIVATWEPPRYPNGILVGYVLHFENTTYSMGLETSRNITGLQAFTSYEFRLEACTVIGCTSSSMVYLQTAELAPEFVESPQLTVFGTRRIDARWSAPGRLNGILQRYLIYMSMISSEIGEIVYNSSDIGFLRYTNESLVSGTRYYYTLGVCTGGGCTVSLPASARTIESAPDLVQDPVITPLSSSALNIRWSPPLLPNGLVTQYSLSQNAVPGVYVSSDILEYNSTGLLPYSVHTFQLTVCTAEGCTLSNEVEVRTLEAPPAGEILLEVERPILSARTARAKWNRVAMANGVVTYAVIADGLYYINPEGRDYTTLSGLRELLNTSEADSYFTVSGLLPYTEYKLQINASNSAGSVISNIVTINTPAGSPDGVQPPALFSPNATTIRAAWGLPGRVNGPTPPGAVYQLFYRNAGRVDQQQAFSLPTTVTSYTKSGLHPYTEYEFMLETINEVDSTTSGWTSIITQQAAPSSMNPPVATGITSRSVSLSWSSPEQPNGVILSYILYRNGTENQTILGNKTTAEINNLVPYTVYSFSLQACTIAGCSPISSSRHIATAEDVPEGLSAPVGTALSPTSILLTWTVPRFPNGIILSYILERKISSLVTVTLASVQPRLPLSYVDEGQQLMPFTEYFYRVKATTVAGTAVSNWTGVRTQSSRPIGVQAPVLQALSPTSLQIRWNEPTTLNGVLIRYVITHLKVDKESSISLSPNTTQITIEVTAYTTYSVTVAVCTDGGCTESRASNITTPAARPAGLSPPTAFPISQTYIAIQWAAPQLANGPDVRYSLTRMKIRQPLVDSAGDLYTWVDVDSTSSLSHNDVGLTVYTSYIYRVTVFNSAGFAVSGNSSIVTTHGGQPMDPPITFAAAYNHTTVTVNWTLPGEIRLQGSPQLVYIFLSGPDSFMRNVSTTPDTRRTIFSGLQPNTQYGVSATVIIVGGNSITSQEIVVTTLDGAPEGIDPPQVFIVSDAALRVSWLPPSRPNGAITLYRLYLDRNLVNTFSPADPRSYLLAGLQPFTVFTLMIEVCTEYDCAQSETIQATTAEAPPLGLREPDIIVTSSVSTVLTWRPPVSPNGIIQAYNIYRRSTVLCSQVEEPRTPSTPSLNVTSVCSYHICGPLEGLCGSTCYSGIKVCCEGIVYDPVEGFECCDSNYIPGRSSNDDVCCGDRFVAYQENHECCNSRYVPLNAGEVCCSEASVNRVNVGAGDLCCGIIPYVSDSAQICCGGQLSEKLGKQCCGGVLVNDTLECCGDSLIGKTYPRQKNSMQCCGDSYIASDRSICCSRGPYRKAHIYSSPESKIASDEKCCGLELISRSLSCCNSRGYDASLYTCADIGQGATSCGMGTVCPLGSAAFCDTCSFDNTNTCIAVTDDMTMTDHGPQPTDPSLSAVTCLTSPALVYEGLQLTYTDNNLKPWTMYQYALSVVNRAGTFSTTYQTIRTAEASPTNVKAPSYTLTENQLHIISLQWEEPDSPNGQILNYSLWRSADHAPVIIYSGLGFLYDDSQGIQPFQTYLYFIEACTIAGCTSSPTTEAATLQAPPEDVRPPSIIFVNATSVLLRWPEPGQPNGIIVSYTLYSGMQTWNVDKDLRQIAIADLEPYTEYSFLLEACTEASCTNSSAVSLTTHQAVPAGLDPPRSLIVSATTLILTWSEPVHPYGVLNDYRLWRVEEDLLDWLIVYAGPGTNHTDGDLSPGRVYRYYIEVGNQAGNEQSQTIRVEMPTETPLNISAPTTARAESAHSILVEWELLADPFSLIDQYQVAVNSGVPGEFFISVSVSTTVYLLQGLSPYTVYAVRIRACLKGVINSCGSGPSVLVRTLEAAPRDFTGPTLTALSFNAIRVEWTEPTSSNGIILGYYAYRRISGETDSALQYTGDGQSLTFTDDGDDILPFTSYEYQIKCNNSVGDVATPWIQVRTLEAAPDGLSSPRVSANGPFGLRLTWTPAIYPNGVILFYEIEYREIPDDPTFTYPISHLRVTGVHASTSFSGLKPYTVYEVRLSAANSAGSVSTNWTQATTEQSSPSGIQPIMSQPHENGRSILLTWFPPEFPNGVITVYYIYESGSDDSIYSGISTEFRYSRLDPFTLYTISLEACTVVGCVKGSEQQVITAEALPESQPNAEIVDVTATTAKLRYSLPLKTNGPLIHLELLRLRNSSLSKRAVMAPDTVFNVTLETSEDSNGGVYTDCQLLPHTRYLYKIRSGNSRGYIDSDWTVVDTQQGSPSHVESPTIAHFDDDYGTLNVTWLEPSVTNGFLTSYLLRRNASVPWTFQPSAEKIYIDSGLAAFTFYSYTLTVCTAGGCTESDPTTIRTLQAAPLFVSVPEVFPTSSMALYVNWTLPQIVKGIIAGYELRIDGEIVYTGLNTEYLISNLRPYTRYQLRITACSGGGCTISDPVLTLTLPDLPTGLGMPDLQVLSSSSVEVRWSEPAQPNGVILSYELYRDGQLVFDGLAFSYVDNGLNSDTTYSYRVKATNSEGSITSSIVSIRTYASSPQGLAPPSLQAVTSRSIQANWSPPSRPNGAIRNYTLYDDFTRDILFTGLELSTAVTDLEPFTDYTMRVQACTAGGCFLSAPSSTRTLEARPSGLDKPLLTPQAAPTGAHMGILVRWDTPRLPNGLITGYALERKIRVSGEPDVRYSSIVSVYNGTSLEYFDQSSDLLPATQHEYRVQATNSAGSITSLWSWTLTYQAAPEGVQPPQITQVQSRSIQVRVFPPSAPNGEIISYSLQINDSIRVVSIIGSTFTIDSLLPFTTYTLRLAVCTSVGCGLSSVVTVSTHGTVPESITAPTITDITHHSVIAGWVLPVQSNEDIQGVVLYQRTSCPHAPQPFDQGACAPGETTVIQTLDLGVTQYLVDGLSPHSMFQWKIEAVNEFGASSGNLWSQSTLTLSTTPEYKSAITFSVTSGQLNVDWTTSFRFNGPLVHSQFYKRSTLGPTGEYVPTLVAGNSSRQISVSKQDNEEVEFFVKILTTRGNAQSTVFSVPRSTDPSRSTTDISGMTEIQIADSTPVWLIVIIVVAVVLTALAIFVILRYCICGRGKPYEREKQPLAKRQLRQQDEVMFQNLNDSLSFTVPPSGTNTNPSTSSHATPLGLAYNKISTPQLSAYTNEGFTDLNRGAIIWPPHMNISPAQQAASSRQPSLEDDTTAMVSTEESNSSIGFVPHNLMEPLPAAEEFVMKGKSDSTEDVWDSVLHDSALFDSDFSEDENEISSIEYPEVPTSFTDTHL